MSMDQRQFEALVQRMERFAVRAPGTYRSWVLALAVFGYTLLLALVIVLLLLLALLAFGLRDAAWLGVKLGLVVGALLLVVLRSLWVRLQPPTGEPLTPQQAPALFARLHRLAARLLVPARAPERVRGGCQLGAAHLRGKRRAGAHERQCDRQLPARAVLAGGRRTGARHGAAPLRALRRAQREPAAAFACRGRPALAGPGAGGTDPPCRHTSRANGAAQTP